MTDILLLIVILDLSYKNQKSEVFRNHYKKTVFQVYASLFNRCGHEHEYTFESC